VPIDYETLRDRSSLSDSRPPLRIPWVCAERCNLVIVLQAVWPIPVWHTAGALRDLAMTHLRQDRPYGDPKDNPKSRLKKLAQDTQKLLAKEASDWVGLRRTQTTG
jgi:hypothetical protein